MALKKAQLSQLFSADTEKNLLFYILMKLYLFCGLLLQTLNGADPSIRFQRGKGCGIEQPIQIIGDQVTQEENDEKDVVPIPECTLVTNRALFSQIDQGRPGNLKLKNEELFYC